MKPIVLYAVIAFLVIPVYPHFVSPNEFTRWALAAAIVEDGTLEVSRQAAVLGPRFEDLSVIEGRTYSNKPPGLAMVGLPGYLIARTFSDETALRAAVYFMRWFGSTIPLLLLAMTFLAIGQRMEVEAPSNAAVFTLLFATPLFAYGLLLFSHAIVAACLFGAWALLFPLRTSRASDVGAGALIGLSILCESAAVYPAAVLFVLAVQPKRPGIIGGVIAGGLPFAAVYALYNHLAFGSVFELSHFHEKSAAFQGAAGTFGVPSARAMFELLAGPAKGLFVFSPVLLAALFRLRVAREHLSTRGFLGLVGVPIASLIFAASYINWHGGWTVGPRYILGAIPFLVFPLLLSRVTRVEALLLGFSTAAVALVSLVFPFVPEDFPFPWGTFAGPLFGDGLGAPNLLHLARLPAAQVIPLLLVGLGLVVSMERRFALTAIGGVALALLIGYGANATVGRSPLLRLQRGYIADVYFGNRGALEESVGGAERTPQSMLRRRQFELGLPPGEWPFTY